MTTPPPNPVSAPSKPANNEPSRTKRIKTSVVTGIGWSDAPRRPISGSSLRRTGLAPFGDQDGEEDHVEKRHDGYRQFQHKRARFVELVHHEIVELAHGPKLLVDEIAIFGDSEPCRCNAIDSRVVDVAHEFDRVVDPLGQLHYVQANGIESLGIARKAPPLPKQIPLGF